MFINLSSCFYGFQQYFCFIINQNSFLKPKIKTGFDWIRSVSVRLTLWIQLYCWQTLRKMKFLQVTSLNWRQSLVAWVFSLCRLSREHLTSNLITHKQWNNSVTIIQFRLPVPTWGQVSHEADWACFQYSSSCWLSHRCYSASAWAQDMSSSRTPSPVTPPWSNVQRSIH